MPGKKPSKPWRLLRTTPGQVVETKHRSQPEAYRAVAAEKERIANGASRVIYRDMPVIGYVTGISRNLNNSIMFIEVEQADGHVARLWPERDDWEVC